MIYNAVTAPRKLRILVISKKNQNKNNAIRGTMTINKYYF